MRREQKIEMEAPWSEVTARYIVAEVDELSWRCRKRSPFQKTSAWIFCAVSNRQVAHPSHLLRAQLGFLCEVTPAPRTSEPIDEPSARIFCASEPRTGDTRRNPRDDQKENLRTEYLTVQFRHFLIELCRPSGARPNCAQSAVPSPE